MDSRKADVLHHLFHSMKDHELKENNIRLCPECKGTGLLGLTKYEDSGYAWDGSYCKTCDGVGFLVDDVENIVIDKSNYLCRECFGKGCTRCNYSGLVDWITHLMGG
jgi:DnaJ-class molecular chaperone